MCNAFAPIVGKPYEGKLHVRFDEGAVESWTWSNDPPRRHRSTLQLRNVANKIPKKLQSACMVEASKIYRASSKEEALRELKHWSKVWGGIVPEAVHCLEEDFEELTEFFQCPEFLWKSLRTTNVIERVFREVRRRTRPISCFQNRDSVERIIFAIFHRQNNLWKEKLLWDKKTTSKF